MPATCMWLVAAALPAAVAARVGGALFRVAGPLLRKHRHILRNLHQALPQASPAELRRVARGVWGNLGAVLFEYPHLERIVDERVTVTMPASVEALFASQRPMLVLTGHLGNWELLGNYMGRQPNGMVGVYGPNDNPVLDRLIQRFRAQGGCEFVTKQEVLRRATPRFLKGRSLGLLPDVRVDSGVPLALFGRDAPTTISPARIALRIDYPLVPARVKRLGPARFEIEFHEPLTPRSGYIGKRAAVDLMAQFNALLEDWVSERPAEWMCTKRRWPREV